MPMTQQEWEAVISLIWGDKEMPRARVRKDQKSQSMGIFYTLAWGGYAFGMAYMLYRLFW